MTSRKTPVSPAIHARAMRAPHDSSAMSLPCPLSRSSRHSSRQRGMIMLGKSCCGLFVACVATATYAGTSGPIVDSRYGSNGVAAIPIDFGGDNNDVPSAAAVLSDGSLIVGGDIEVATGSGVGDDNYHQL